MFVHCLLLLRYVVYFDLILGAACTSKLVKIVVLAFIRLLSSFHTFTSFFTFCLFV